MKYAHVDENNFLLGWYDPNIHGEAIPKDCIKVSESDWQFAINNNHNKIYADGSSEYIEPVLPDEEKAIQIRQERDALLEGSDWTQLPDAPVDQAAWAEYRQALRGLPQQAGFPTEVTWPIKPE